MPIPLPLLVANNLKELVIREGLREKALFQPPDIVPQNTPKTLLQAPTVDYNAQNEGIPSPLFRPQYRPPSITDGVIVRKDLEKLLEGMDLNKPYEDVTITDEPPIPEILPESEDKFELPGFTPKQGDFQLGGFTPTDTVSEPEILPVSEPDTRPWTSTAKPGADLKGEKGKITEYGPETPTEIVKPTLEKLKGETLDQAIERSVGYQIDNGKVKLEKIADGWKATIKDVEEPKIIQAFSKQEVLNETYKFLNPDYGVVAPTAKGGEITDKGFDKVYEDIKKTIYPQQEGLVWVAMKSKSPDEFLVRVQGRDDYKWIAEMGSGAKDPEMAIDFYFSVRDKAAKLLGMPEGSFSLEPDTQTFIRQRKPMDLGSGWRHQGDYEQYKKMEGNIAPVDFDKLVRGQYGDGKLRLSFDPDKVLDYSDTQRLEKIMDTAEFLQKKYNLSPDTNITIEGNLSNAKNLGELTGIKSKLSPNRDK